MMSNQTKQGLGPLKLLKKYREVSPQNTQNLIQQRMIYMASLLIESGHRCEQIDVNQQIITFIEKMNAKIVNTKDLNFDEKIHILGKCFDMLVTKNVRSLIYPFQKQLHLRALCLNNLSIVYKQNKQLQDALKAVDEAINIQQTLLSKQYPGMIISISSTYINRCVILSALNNHQQAAETITKSLRHLNEYLDLNRELLGPKQIQDLQYTQMFAHFNLAVEYEHLGLSKLAVQHFQIAYKQAKDLGDWQLRDRVVQALKSLRKK